MAILDTLPHGDPLQQNDRITRIWQRWFNSVRTRLNIFSDITEAKASELALDIVCNNNEVVCNNNEVVYI